MSWFRLGALALESAAVFAATYYGYNGEGLKMALYLALLLYVVLREMSSHIGLELWHIRQEFVRDNVARQKDRRRGRL